MTVKLKAHSNISVNSLHGIHRFTTRTEKRTQVKGLMVSHASEVKLGVSHNHSTESGHGSGNEGISPSSPVQS